MNEAIQQQETQGNGVLPCVSASTYGSLLFPFIIYEGTDPNNVIEVSEIVSISGMADNNGTPTELTIYKHVKGKETERLVYKLVH